LGIVEKRGKVVKIPTSRRVLIQEEMTMRSLFALILGLTCVMALPRLSVGQEEFSPFHEVLRGVVLVVSGPAGVTQRITLRLTIQTDPVTFSSHVTGGSLHCHTRGIPECPGQNGALSNFLVSMRENSPREVGFVNFDTDVTFVQEGKSCHFMGVMPGYGNAPFEFISGSYTCANTSGAEVETGTIFAMRRCK
jgi:hypothetical protein